MPSEAEELLEAGNHALSEGDWVGAAESYRAALALNDSGDARFRLAVALWWLGQPDEALRHWEGAYTSFRRRGEPVGAVLTAVYLCLAFQMAFGNDTAARGWLGRAASLVDEFDLPGMNGWVLLCRAYMANDAGQPRVAETCAREGLEIARQGGDGDLALCVSAELGAALVALGNMEEGADLLDQAMAAALAGEAGDLDSVVLISCRTISSYSRAAEITRAVQWIRAANGFNQRYGSTHLHMTCRTHHGRVLFAAGEWQRAEEELEAALEIGGGAEPALHAEASASLAGLRLAQGRFDDAGRLLAGSEDQPASAHARAALQLASGFPAVTATLVRRRLRDLEGDRLARAELLELLTEAEVALGQADDLAALLPELEELTRRRPALASAYARRALGRAAAVSGDPAAVDHFEQALSAFGSLGLPYECARTRVLLAKSLAPVQRETAIAEARTALTCFEDLGAARDADAAAAALRSLGVKAARTGPKGLGLLTKREREILSLLGEGLANRDIAERLFISRRTVEHHVASVLSKLGLGGRAEAAAYAVRHLHRSSASG